MAGTTAPHDVEHTVGSMVHTVLQRASVWDERQMMDTPSEHKVWRDDPRVVTLNTWINREGARGQPQLELVETYCEQLTALDVPLLRVHVTVNALHPVYGSVGLSWRRDSQPQRHEYGHNSEVPEDWLQSPFYHMITTGTSEYRERIVERNEPSQFPFLTAMRSLGATDYYAAATLFGEWEEGAPIDLDARVEGAMMSWMSHAQDGFTDRDLALIRATFPSLCLALRANSNRQTAEDLLSVYLGRDAGHRVLSGEIQRGSSQWIDAVICYFDLEGFTGMSQKIAGEELIALLNDYFGLVVNKIEAHGGNVLKFMGDGLLAIFDRTAFSDAPDRAVTTVRILQKEIATLNATHAAHDQRTLGYTIALHAGPVLYGNIGADERLDFTVIGPEVNLGARISGMHKSLGQPVIISDTVATEVTQSGFELISLGRYMLRGVDEPRELFTIYADTP